MTTQEKGLKAFWSDLIKLAISFTILSGILGLYKFVRKWFVDPHITNTTSQNTQTSKNEVKHVDNIDT